MYKKREKSICEQCVSTHTKNGQNYEWLDIFGYGPVKNIWFEEPVESNNWRLYTEKWWRTHCKAVDHDENLFESHMRAFVDKDKRFARLMFLFEDNTLMEPTQEFYELEEEYFKDRGLCK